MYQRPTRPQRLKARKHISYAFARGMLNPGTTDTQKHTNMHNIQRYLEIFTLRCHEELYLKHPSSALIIEIQNHNVLDIFIIMHFLLLYFLLTNFLDTGKTLIWQSQWGLFSCYWGQPVSWSLLNINMNSWLQYKVWKNMICSTHYSTCQPVCWLVHWCVKYHNIEMSILLLKSKHRCKNITL